jgi:hypothetical protein
MSHFLRNLVHFLFREQNGGRMRWSSSFGSVRVTFIADIDRIPFKHATVSVRPSNSHDGWNPRLYVQVVRLNGLELVLLATVFVVGCSTSRSAPRSQESRPSSSLTARPVTTPPSTPAAGPTTGSAAAAALVVPVFPAVARPLQLDFPGECMVVAAPARSDGGEYQRWPVLCEGADLSLDSFRRSRLGQALPAQGWRFCLIKGDALHYRNGDLFMSVSFPLRGAPFWIEQRIATTECPSL